MMKFDVFCEIQRAFPWKGKDEASLLHEVLAQAKAAEAAGFDIWWQVEHHGAPQFSYSSAPEVVLPTTEAPGTARKAIAVNSDWLCDISSTKITTVPV